MKALKIKIGNWKLEIGNFRNGQVMIITLILFLGASLIAIFGIVNPILQHLRTAYNGAETNQGYYLAESGIEDAVYRLFSGKQIPASYNFSLGSFNSQVVVSNTATGKSIISTGNRNDFVRTLQTDLQLGDGVSFHYGIQSGNGGFVMQNSSTVTGNVFSSGTITGAGNNIYGEVISAGASGLINGIHATGTAFAHTIQNSTIDKDAYYVVKTNTTVSGISYPNSPDQPPADLPISDAQISDWESDATAGGTINCPVGKTEYLISANASLGPKKINCNLHVKGTAGGITLTVTGPIWVVGDIALENNTLVKMDPSLGSSNVAVIAHDPSATSTKGYITIEQNTNFQDSGSPGSFVFMISQNNNAETGGSNDAIVMGQSAGALVVYASHGQITLGQSVNLKEVTAWKIILKNTANVTYDRGLPSVLFSAGPSGGYSILDWQEN